MREYIYQPKKICYWKNEFKSDRSTLVFIHGLSGSSSAWLPYGKKFTDKYNILTFDLRGHGKSWKPTKLEDYTIQKFAEDLFELLINLKIKKFVLISHSFGVLIALEFMSAHLEMVEKVIFLSPSFTPSRMLTAKIIKPLLKFVGIFKIIPFNQEGRRQIDYSRFKNTGDWNIPRMIADISITSLHVYLYCTKQSYEVDYEKLLNQIKIPTLIMHGRKDTIFSVNNSLVMSEKIKNSRLIIIENSDHILVLNNFAEVSAAIENFIVLPLF